VVKLAHYGSHSEPLVAKKLLGVVIMMLTKKDLKKMYNEGKLKDSGYFNPSAFDVIMLVEWTDEIAFGYYQYQDGKKEFFFRKMEYNITSDTCFFKLNNRRYHLDNFMRMNF
jgi:hypothetical protein